VLVYAREREKAFSDFPSSSDGKETTLNVITRVISKGVSNISNPVLLKRNVL